MTHDQFNAAGAALYGPQWRSQLAQALGMSAGHVRDIAAGRKSVTPRTALAIKALARERGLKLLEIAG